MELFEAIESNGTCRRYKSDPVPAQMIGRALEAARFAPSGGNRQPVRFVIVTDPALREQLAALYLPHWEQYVGALRSGAVQVHALPRGVEAADRFARGLARVPVLAVVCARLADCLATDQSLGRLSVVGGASIYPAVQNFLLACRAQGLGTALTTLLCLEEPRVKTLLGIPEDIATVATIAVGFPESAFPRRLRRKPLGEVAFANRYGQPLA
jgi:nitroreductase